jgi:acyl-coenzyme A thioesterase PaaI-like protein
MDQTEIDSLLRSVADSPCNACFVCGPGNPNGLHTRFDRTETGTSAHFTPAATHLGWQGVVHGGILAALLDEAMAYSLFFSGSRGLTGRMEVRYRFPVFQGETLTVEGAIVRDSHRIADIEASLIRSGQRIAKASGRFFKLGPLTRDALESHVLGNRE